MDGSRKRKAEEASLAERNLKIPTQSTGIYTGVSTSALIECEVCLDEKAADAFPTKTTASCEHNQTICRGCIEQTITSQVDDNITKIFCPHSDCSEVLSHTDVKAHSTKETFSRYDDLVTFQAVRSMESFIPCPKARCRGGHFHEAGVAEPIFTCKSCRAKYCVVCNAPWHRNLTCEQFAIKKKAKLERQAKSAEKAAAVAEMLAEKAAREAEATEKKRLEEEAAEAAAKAAELEAAQLKKQEQDSVNLIREISKECPGKGCGWRIQKNNGCDHMTCTRCGHQFCWLCRTSWTPIIQNGNHFHDQSCKHYRPLHDPEPPHAAVEPDEYDEYIDGYNEELLNETLAWYSS
ncbi:hypothetical protein BU16DRAFT_534187 [Lophium mytilinum]|uniref:RBR-type E3 ubiquitin transferase n=1 Tax=Lophium mytilinum TaxID=390894 RepID=A0A6A6RA29_9PEZI|nr:hypothetical protein BU16DRAFT_534187 [Lophium mytilinum]